MRWIWLSLIVPVACLLLSAGCSQIPLVNPDATIEERPVPSTPSPTQAVIETAVTEEAVATPAVSRGIESVAGLMIWVENANLDLSPGDDGLLIHYRFLDNEGRPVSFSGQSIRARIVVRTPPIDNQNLRIKPRTLYDGSLTITSSEDGEDYPLRGIRLDYDMIDLLPADRGIGSVTLTVTLPDGRIFSATETYLYPQ
ncbi:MAG: hypothetical protein ACXQTG_03395 [Methanoculleaceae archaeon]